MDTRVRGSGLTKRVLAGVLALSLGFGRPALAGAPGIGGIVYDPSNWVQNYNSVVNSLTQIGQLGQVIANGAVTIQNLLQMVGLATQTLSGINGLISNTTYLLSGRLFVDYYNQVVGIYQSLVSEFDSLVAASNNAGNLGVSTNTLTDTTTQTGQEISAYLMDGQQEQTSTQTNHDRLIQYVDYQMNVELPLMYQLQEEVLETTYKMECLTQPLNTLRPEIYQTCQNQGLISFNIPALTQAASTNQQTINAINQSGGINNPSYGQGAEGQNQAFSVQIETTQTAINATIAQAQLILQQYQTILQAKQAQLEVARASLERSSREEEIRALSANLTQPYLLATEIEQFYGP